MSNEFLNKRILITGASSGIGLSTAMYFLNSGAKVALCGRDMETLKKIGKKFPNQASVINLDLSEDLLLFDLKSTVIEILGGLDILVNCAGIIFDGDVEKTFPQDYDYTVDVNLRAVYILIKSFKMYFQRNSSVVNVSCLYGTKPQNGLTSYCMSKAGVEMLTKFAAAEFAVDGIRVNAITSCPVDTNSQRYVGVSETEYNGFKSRVSENIPLGRMANPDDIAKAIIFLASSRSSKITGQVIKVDGGRSLTTSGWVPWRGMGTMNSRFEPDGMKPMLKLKDIYARYTGQGERKTFYPENEEDIEKLIHESNWATRLSEAHEKVSANYKNIEANDNYLQKFIK
jgi:NAD(P)-dependent dehydrogenase (short-subunit alcohol dehydrogenase family)